ncbi:hypothetical protein Dsin_027910 [Dipteronia sinensis]|uniref:FBD domain-containing protein n=1 Tax=Dipteronia sinensis TaxID=43782 RepID=A0AAE0DU30_9ROSI|nr:hypothetical protein Dsin_027910 [Dipteronia sinensis]
MLHLKEIYLFSLEWKSLELDVIKCLLLHLKEIYLFSLEWKSLELDMIKCLLENSRVLERFSVHIWPGKDKQEIQNEILNFPRASPIAKLNFLTIVARKSYGLSFVNIDSHFTILA